MIRDSRREIAQDTIANLNDFLYGWRMPTPFQQRVYDALCEVPKGRVTTYQLLARAVECGSSQAGGQALKRNPYAPEAPCHRVIRADLTLGGFAGEVGGPEVTRKRRLLKAEGVEFDAEGKLIDSGRVFRFTSEVSDPIS